jgi:hypothetical protein
MSQLFRNKRILTIIVGAVFCSTVFLYHTSTYLVDNVVIAVGVCLAVLCIAVWKPFFAFAMFVGMIPVEIISAFPEQSAIFVRPYQILGIASLVGYAIRHSFKVERSRMIQWCSIDVIVAIFITIGFMTVWWADDPSLSLMQTVVVASFGVLYVVVRLFVSDIKDALAMLPLLIASGFFVSVYAIAQNIIFRTGGYHLEVMPGRPNATFSEPDWLGVYLVFILSASLTYLYHNAYHKHIWRFFDMALFGATVVVMTALIITVARSAWVGAIAVFLGYYGILIAQKQYKLFARHFVWTLAVSVIALASVVIFQLTTFELGNRAHSAGTGMQKITVSCDDASTKEHVQNISISTLDDLSIYGCRHINLEDIDREQDAGYFITTVYRPDPNIGVRSDIYEATVRSITQRPWSGYGWGSSGRILGTDLAGTPLNASNIFFETALSIGLAGAIALCAIFVTIGVYAMRVWHNKTDSMHKTIAVFAIVGCLAIIVPNLFNAGLLLGYVWIFFGTVAILCKK